MAASSLPPPDHHQIHHPKKKNRLAFAFTILFSLFLFAVVLFSKRSLEPTTTIYTDLSLPSSPTPSDLPPPPLTQVPEPVSLDKGSSSGSNADISLPPTPPPEAPVEVTQVPKPVVLDDGPTSSETNWKTNENSSNGESGFLQDENPRMDVKCDLYSGGWVRDEEERYPLYSPGSCPYVDDAFTCQENGRKDKEYLKWRWKPHDCDLPRFNAKDFLERLRGKRLMLVGDSMNRNQFESMLCLLREALPDKSKMYETRGYKITKGRGYFIFQFVDYNCTVEFCRSHFLVREGVRANAQGKTRPTLSIDRIDKLSSRWKHANILIFNTGHWWTHRKTSRGKDYYQEGDFVYPTFDSAEAFRRSMRTWGRWIDNNMRPGKNVVFYRGYSTAHFRGGDWDSGGTCSGETEPIFIGRLLENYPWKMRVVEEIINEMQFPVILLNVTRLTNIRKDGHPSIYRKNWTEGQRVSSRKQDCSHWCLPGIPDAWNELIYANLVLEQMKRNDN